VQTIPTALSNSPRSRNSIAAATQELSVSPTSWPPQTGHFSKGTMFLFSPYLKPIKSTCQIELTDKFKNMK
jgi:hypothetical protein